MSEDKKILLWIATIIFVVFGIVLFFLWGILTYPIQTVVAIIAITIIDALFLEISLRKDNKKTSIK